MKSKINSAVNSAIVRLLKPLVRILLRNNIPYGSFAELAKWVYVDVASKEFGIPRRKLSISRVSILTGLSRKEVRRLKEIAEPDDLGASDRYNRAARVISGWLKDKRFLDEKGAPRELFFEAEEPSFSSLVKLYSGDVPSRAVRDEMLRAGVIELWNDRVRLLEKGYIVKQGDVEKLGIMGVDVGELISTIHHNILSDPEETFLQQKVFYDNIPEDLLPEVKKKVSEKGRKLIQAVDRLMSQYDRDMNPSLKGPGRKKAGLGVFYFE
jgi:hypothetical protein